MSSNPLYNAEIIVLRSSRMFWSFLTENFWKEVLEPSLKWAVLFNSQKILKNFKTFLKQKKCKQEQRLLIRRRKLEIQLFNVKSTTTLGSFTEHSNIGRSLSCTHTHTHIYTHSSQTECVCVRVCVCVSVQNGQDRREERERDIWSSSSYNLHLKFGGGEGSCKDGSRARALHNYLSNARARAQKRLCHKPRQFGKRLFDLWVKHNKLFTQMWVLFISLGGFRYNTRQYNNCNIFLLLQNAYCVEGLKVSMYHIDMADLWVNPQSKTN